MGSEPFSAKQWLIWKGGGVGDAALTKFGRGELSSGPRASKAPFPASCLI